GRWNIFALAGVFRVFDQADDLDLIDASFIEAEALADGIFVGKTSTRERLIDDYYARRALVVLPREGSPGQQGNFHRLQKVFARLMNVYPASVSDLPIRSPYVSCPVARTPGQQPGPRECDRLSAGQGFQTLAQSLVELREFFAIVSGERRLNVKQQQ